MKVSSKAAAAASVAVLATTGGFAVASAQNPMPMKTTAAPRGMRVAVRTRPGPHGVVLHIVTRRFRWAPQRLSATEGAGRVVRGEGHAHLYVDGATMPTTLVVAPWTYLGLTPGPHTLRVTLNADNHAEYVRAGRPVEASATVDVAAAPSM
jgi:hypothetical protein